ncbi:hypothetical protein DdX_16505 [Ditylenchus destructor]|uniref:Uncharacterized protein n=1 Tax=Ditylenchus destructor TaxID=166010 RepID=A0AAD4MMX1_9BILA|nr:hypothetical protein DdX_16505 [Ditylenchus destructor]
MIRHARVIDLMEDAALEEQAQEASEKMKGFVEELEMKGNERVEQATREAEKSTKNALEEQKIKYDQEIEKQQIEHERRLELAITKKEMEVREFFTEKMNAIRIEFEEKLDAEVKKTKDIRAEGGTRLKEAEIRLDKAIGEHKAAITAEQKKRDDLRKENAETKRKAEKKLESAMAQNKDATAAAENRIRLEEREKQKLEMIGMEAKHEKDLLQKLQEAQKNNEMLLKEAQKAHEVAITEARINADKSSLQQSEHLKQLLKEEANARNELVKLFLAQIETEAKNGQKYSKKSEKKCLQEMQQLRTIYALATTTYKELQRHDKDRQRVIDDLMASKNRELKQVTEMFKAEIERVTSDERERSQREITRIQEESSSKVAAFENRIQQLESMKLKLEDSVKRLELALAKKEAAKKRRKVKAGRQEELDSLVSPTQSANVEFGKGRNESPTNQKLGNSGKPTSEIDRADEYDDAEVDARFAVTYGLKDLIAQKVLDYEVKSNLDIEEWRTGVYNATMHRESVEEIVGKFSDVLFEGAEMMAENCLNGKRSNTHSRKNPGAQTSGDLTSDQSSSKFVSFPQTSVSGPKSTVPNSQNVATVSENNIGTQKMVPPPRMPSAISSKISSLRLKR